MKRPLFIFLLALAAYLLTGAGHLFSPDDEVLFRMTRSLARGEGLAVEPLGGFATRQPATPRADGREYAQYGIGQPLLAVPFYWAGATLAHVGGDGLWQRIYGRPARGPAEWEYPATAAELAPRWACSWFNCFVGAGLALLAYLIALELTDSETAATWSALLYALGTMAWPHARPFFSESLASFWIVLAWYALIRGVRARERKLLPWCVLAGAAAGYAALVRMDSVLAYPGLALVLLGPIVQACRTRKIQVGLAWAGFALPALAAGFVLLLLNKLHFGGALATGYADQPEGVNFSTPLLGGLFLFLFSAGRGLFFFSPPLLIGLWGWVLLYAKLRQRHAYWLAAVVLAILAPLLMQARWQNPAGGWCWGPRHIFIIHFFLMLPVAAWLAQAARSPRRIVATTMLALGMFVQVLGCSQDFIAFYDQFFRAPGSSEAFFIRYDPIDYEFWAAHYHLQFKQNGPDAWRDVPLVPPVPIQDSLYHPQRSVWAGYPQMIRAGQFDNFWLRLLLGDAAPAITAPKPPPLPPPTATPLAAPPRGTR